MKTLLGALGVLLVLILSMAFAALNGGQRVILRLGFVTVYGIPLTIVVFGSMVLGMLIMLVAGIRSDLRVRRILRERLAREDEEERARIFVDRHQQDLFEGTVEEGAPPADAPEARMTSTAGVHPEPPRPGRTEQASVVSIEELAPTIEEESPGT